MLHIQLNVKLMLTPKNLGKILLLTAAHPLFLLTLPSAGSPGGVENLLFAFIAALVPAFVLAQLVTHHRGISKWRLMLSLCLLFYGTTFLQSGIEAVLFLNYMQTTMSREQLISMFVFGGVVTVVIVPLSVLLFYSKREPEHSFALPAKTLFLRSAGLGILYMVIYALFGALVFKPLAGEHFNTYYGNMQMPDWLFPFQIIRGFFWVLLAYWLMLLLPANRKYAVYAIVLFIALPFSSLLLPANEVMPAPIRFSHLVEVLSSMLLFAFVVARYLTKPVKDRRTSENPLPATGKV